MLCVSYGVDNEAMSNLYHNTASLLAEKGDFKGSIEYRLKVRRELTVQDL